MKKKTGFEKFHKVKSGSALKEQIRQEKKKITKERKEYFEAKRQEKFKPSAFSNQQGVKSPESRGTTNYKPALPAGRPQTTNSKLQTPNSKPPTPDSSQMPLNKFIAHSGVCSRRDAAELIKSGKVKLNGEVVTEPGRKVTLKDAVTVGGKKVYPVNDLVYILLNKPKDYITTTDDPQQRKTVLDLITGATKDRVYPVGRLDRNTSGVLLLTNDGELAQKLIHPSNEIKKVYAVTLDKPLEKRHFDEILKGVPLEDGMANVDVLAYTDAGDKRQIGVEIHSGRNRIVRRIFEKFGYDVKGLDRVMFAGLTKKNVNRGKWRYLNEKEVRDLKYFKKGK
jgi:23S rRNA pseudouridine2605 synthase